MKKQGYLRNILLISISVILVLSLGGCSKEDKEYVTNFQNSLNEVAKENQNFVEFVEKYFTSFDGSEKTKILDSIKKLEGGYGKLKALKAPKKYTDAQKIFVEGSDLALSALKIYKDEITAVTKETLNLEFANRLTKGDEIMKQANDKMVAAANKVKDIDNK